MTTGLLSREMGSVTDVVLECDLQGRRSKVEVWCRLTVKIWRWTPRVKRVSSEGSLGVEVLSRVVRTTPDIPRSGRPMSEQDCGWGSWPGHEIRYCLLNYTRPYKDTQKSGRIETSTSKGWTLWKGVNDRTFYGREWSIPESTVLEVFQTTLESPSQTPR